MVVRLDGYTDDEMGKGVDGFMCILCKDWMCGRLNI